MADDEVNTCEVDSLAPGYLPAERDLLMKRSIPASIPENTAPADVQSAPLVGRLLALADKGGTPLVSFDAQPLPGVMPARSTVDLRPAHVGLEVLLSFEAGDRSRPIVTGVIRGKSNWPLEPQPGRVKVAADGESLTVIATRELVLRCGKAVLTLHSDGRIVMRGEQILTEAKGTNRIRGGSVELN